MTRSRSKSIVKNIAIDVPEFDEIGPTSNASVDRLKLVRSSSSSQLNSIKSRSFLDLTYPFSKEEYKVLNNSTQDYFRSDSQIPEVSLQILQQNKLMTYINFKENCIRNNNKIRRLKSNTGSILNSLERITSTYNNIWNETHDFDTESSTLLDIESSFKAKSSDIENYLSKFENLEAITKHLSHPGTKLVRSSSFQKTLTELDDSIDFVEHHPTFKDVDLYRVKFRQCMTRALTLIKDYLLNELKSLNVSIEAKARNNVSIDLLLFTGFTSFLDTSDFSDLVDKIIERYHKHDEYKGLLSEVLNAYFKLRLWLSHDYIATNLTSRACDVVQDFQDQISFVKGLIDKEHQLFKQFFPNGELENRFLEYCKDLMDPFYDSLRQKILRVTDISKLCQLTTLLQKYYEFEEGQNEISFGTLFEPIFNDAQSRLIFRAQNYVDKKLKNYKPTMLDLTNGHRKDTEPGPLDAEYPENLFPDVYLPLGKALTLLSTIYELINSKVFDDLAHYIVHSCIYLLRHEFYRLSEVHYGPIAAKLNYLKQLIILKSEINNFDIQYVRNDYSIDFLSGLNDIWNDIRRGQLSFNNNGIISLAKKTVPKLITNMIDANYEIESELNNAINDLFTSCINEISQPIMSPDAENPKHNSDHFRKQIKNFLPDFIRKLNQYIEEPNIRAFFLNKLTSLVVISYDNFRTILDQRNERIDAGIMETDELIKLMDDLKNL